MIEELGEILGHAIILPFTIAFIMICLPIILIEWAIRKATNDKTKNEN